MKIVEKKKAEKSTEFKFENGAWVKIHHMDGEYGSWEYQEDEEDEETYSEGGLWFEDKKLVDYDGCYELPEEVKLALDDFGYKFEDEDKRLRR